MGYRFIIPSRGWLVISEVENRCVTALFSMSYDVTQIYLINQSNVRIFFFLRTRRKRYLKERKKREGKGKQKLRQKPWIRWNTMKLLSCKRKGKRRQKKQLLGKLRLCSHSYCAGTKTIPDTRASVHTLQRLIWRDFCDVV